MTQTLVGTPDPEEPEDGRAEAASEALQLFPTPPPPRPRHQRLPRKRPSRTLEFRLHDVNGFVVIGEYEDGRIGEIYMNISKQGSALAGTLDALSQSVSLGLQHGVPLRA